MERKQNKYSVGESSKSGTPSMAFAANFRPPLFQVSSSPSNVRPPAMNNSSNSTSRNNTPNIYIHYRREKIGDSESSSSSKMSERDRELKLSDPAPKLKNKAELMRSESRNISVGKDDPHDFLLLKESSKLKQIVLSDRFVAKPLKISTSAQYSRSGDDFEKKTEVFDGKDFLSKPVKKRIVSDIMNETTEEQKGNTTPVSLVDNSGHSSEKLKEHANAAPKEKSNKMVIRLGTKKKSTNEVVNGGSLNPITEADFAPKTWNLRPRQPPVSKSNGKGSNLQGSTGNEKTAEGQTSEQPKMTGFSISLTKAEIEADFLAMTGAKPPRKLKKRGRVAQRNVDNCFPGMWLHTVTPNSYHIPEKESKI